jgi:hypothetical protein
MVGVGTRKNIGLASARGANRSVRVSKILRNQKARAKLNDPTSRISKARKSIRRGTFNLNKVFDPSSKAERF